MNVSRRAFLVLLVAILVVATGAWLVVRQMRTRPLPVAPAALASWPLIVSNGTDPWIVGLEPPDSLTTRLFQEASRRASRPLVAPPRAALPLVLRSESDEGLQGVYPTDSVLRIARDAGVDTARLEPVCLAHQFRREPGGSAELYFAAFESFAFNQFRIDLIPPQPEHAGIGIYEPSLLTPILMVGATDPNFERWWPLRFDPADDCEVSLQTPAAQN